MKESIVDNIILVALIVILCIAALITTGCDKLRATENVPHGTIIDRPPSGQDFGGVRRILDHRRGVMCYVYIGYGISCLKVNELDE